MLSELDLLPQQPIYTSALPLHQGSPFSGLPLIFFSRTFNILYTYLVPRLCEGFHNTFFFTCLSENLEMDNKNKNKA